MLVPKGSRGWLQGFAHRLVEFEAVGGGAESEKGKEVVVIERSKCRLFQLDEEELNGIDIYSDDASGALREDTKGVVACRAYTQDVISRADRECAQEQVGIFPTVGVL